ncbi:MAG: hypothetical protein H7831_15505 [Magnetococcus sp. WYHC-3]
MDTISSLLENLEIAKRDFVERSKAASEARNEETSALNRLNLIQKKFDELVAKLRNDALPESDWGKK